MQTQPVDSKPLPPVEQVRPGLWSIPVPLPIVLRYVLVYAFETDRGPYIVDAGWNTDDAFDALEPGLGLAGFAHHRRAGCDGHAHPPRPLRPGRPRPRDVRCVDRAPPVPTRALLHDRYEAPDDLLERMGACSGDSARPTARSRTSATRRCRYEGSSRPRSPTSCSATGSAPQVPGWDITASGRRATRPATCASGSPPTG